MKTILHMGITPNGYIAKPDGDSEWTSDPNLSAFFEHAKVAGNIILGKNTFNEAVKQGYFPFPDAVNVVVTHNAEENKWGDQVVFTDQSPKEILQMLEEKGFSQAFLTGGGIINSAFMKAGLVDEIYFDIEPLVFGKGIKVFTDRDFEFDLKLIDTKKITEDTVQIHYQVLKD